MAGTSSDSRIYLPLQSQSFEPDSAQACRLLSDLGAHAPAVKIDAISAQVAWAQSGAMALTGHANGPPLACPAPLAARMQGAYEALQALSPKPLPELDAAALLGERAATVGHSRNGAISCGGSCRFLSARDGRLAINLARDDDWSLLPALLDGDVADDWQTLEQATRQHTVSELCERAQLLGLAVTPARGEACNPHWFEISATGPQQTPRKDAPLVIDLSSLWAGPLCSHLLQLAGARVIKVESRSRPDGARAGPAAFFDLLHAGKESVALELTSAAGIKQLKDLINAADIVIEASRPRALQQMGIDAEALVASRPGLTWLSITGYGRSTEQAMRIAYGDDAAVAAGLSEALFRHSGEYLFCGDAIADPLTGIHAALAALASWRAGGGYLFDIALQAVVADCLRDETLPSGNVQQKGDNWMLSLGDREIPVAAPRARVADRPARALGADTDAVLAELGLSC